MFHRKFRIDRQPHRRAVLVARQFDRKLDALIGVVAHLDVCGELVSRQHFFQQNSKLPFAPAATRLHVCQHALQSANVTRQLLHRTESLMHLLKSIAHQLERFPEAFLQCALQFFIDGRAHLVDLLCIVLLQLSQSMIDNRAHAFEGFRQFFALILRGCACFLTVA